MIGIRWPCARKVFCNSIPLISGMWMSEIKHEVSINCWEFKKARADGKARPVNPSDCTSFNVLSRIDCSSSMIEITGTLSN